MRAAAVLVVAALVAPAHAMGTDRVDELRAWNDDGSTALIALLTDRDGDRSVSYAVVGVGTKPVTAAVSQTTRENARDVEQLDAATCADDAKRLAKAVAAARMSRVTVSPDQCKRDRAKVVTVAAGQDLGWVALPQNREPTAREQAAWDIVKQLDPTYRPYLPGDCSAFRDGDERAAIDVATTTGKLVLVFTSERCNNPVHMEVTGFVPAKAGYVDAGIWTP